MSPMSKGRYQLHKVLNLLCLNIVGVLYSLMQLHSIFKFITKCCWEVPIPYLLRIDLNRKLLIAV